MKHILLAIFFFSLPIMVLSQNKNEILQSDTTAYTVVDKMPEFPGGSDSLDTYIAHHAVFSEAAIESCLMGKTIIQFIVEKNGTLSNIIIVRELDPGVDKVALSVLKNMPPWTPGEKQGEKVRVKYTFPFKFRKYIEIQTLSNNKNGH